MQTHEWEALLDEATPTSATGLVIPTDADERLRRHTRAAVAEVVRLRRAITDLRDDYLAHIADYDEATVTHMCYGTTADDLTRILEGEA